MKYEIAVLVSQKLLSQALRPILDQDPYVLYELGSMDDVARYMQGRDKGLLIVDLDTEQVNNAVLREVKKNHPITIIAISSEQFHPGLEEAFRHHLFACLTKPLDAEELLYMLRSVFT
jgi:DNA-binding NtrC family response regulator